ncbi:MAG: AI-2E family transporter [Gammaproteobacteria bacterium]|nr:AI-2E family transporter [Gammaproteobacteria bacterium]
MFEVLKRWFSKYFSDPEASILLIALVISFLVIMLFGKILAPLLIGIVIAYLLEIIVSRLQRTLKFPRWLAVTFVYGLFVSLLVLAVIGLFPIIYKQFSQLLDELPLISSQLHNSLIMLPARYPDFVSNKMVQSILNNAQMNPNNFANLGKTFLSVSMASIPSIVTWMVYVFLVPLLVFFFLKDKRQLVTWSDNYMPVQRGLIIEVWHEMRSQLARYVRGKFIELLIIGFASYLTFRAFGLNYPSLLGSLVGLSVIVPYVGFIVVTIPVAIVGILQWGIDTEFLCMFGVYLFIQLMDANVLVPLLFSEAVNLHPVAIIVAVLFFGGIWGFWGLFFAIPLATLVKAVVSAWVRHSTHSSQAISVGLNS